MQAQALFDIQPSGNWVIIKGNSADANADFLRGGAEKVIGDAVAAGDITIVGEDYTDNWDPANAQTTMEQFLTAEDNDIQAALVQNDGMAGGVIAALEAQGLAGQVPVSGQDGDMPPSTGWRSARRPWTSGRTPASSAPPPAKQRSRSVATPTRRRCPARRRSRRRVATTSTRSSWTPIPITQDNLDVVVDAGWISTEDLCAGVDAGSVAACP